MTTDLVKAEDEPSNVLATKELIDSLSRMAMCVSVEEANELVQELERMEAFLPFTDPTAYRKIAPNIPDHKRVAEAFLRFRKQLERVIQP